MTAAHRRRSPLRSLLFILGGIGVVSAALFIVGQSAFSPEKLRTLLQDSVLRATGRALTISGAIHLRLGLSPELEADDIALANIEGGSRPQMLTAKSLRADLALLPLLGGDAVVSALTIEQPSLLLERSADGTPNWLFTPSHRALYQAHGSGGGRHRLQIRSISLIGGQVRWDPQDATPRVIDIGRFSLSATDIDAPMFLSLDGSFDGVGGAVPFTLSGNSGSLQRLQGGGVSALAGTWPLLLKLTLQGADLKLDGGINHPEQMRSFQLRLTEHADDLSVFNPLLPKPYLPPLAHVNLTALVSDNGDGVMRTSQVSMRTEESDLSRLVPGLIVKQATLSAPGPGQLAQLSVEGIYADQPLRFAAAAMQPDFLAATTPVQLTLNAQAAGASLTAHGTLPPSTESGGLDLQIEGRAPDLSTLSSLVGRKLPPAHDLTLTAELQDAGVKLRGVTLHNLVVSSSLGDANGDLTLNWRPRPAVSGTLTSRSLDLDALASGTPGAALPSIWPPPQNTAPPIQVTPPAPASPPSQAAPETSAALPQALPLDFLRTHDATLTVNIGDLTAWGTHYRDVAAHLELQDGKLALNPFRAQADEGALVAGASIDASTDQPPIAISLRSPAIAARAVTSLLGYPGDATGTMQVDAVLSGTGQTLSGFESGMNGRIGLAMVNGQVDNGILQGLLGDILQTEGVATLGDGTTGVHCFAARLDFASGVGRVRALAADTSRLSLSGSGTIDLRDQSADLHLRPQLRIGPTQVSAPVSLQGPFGALKASLDPAFAGGRVGFEIGGASQSGCADALAVARNGLGGPVPAAAPVSPDQGLPLRIKKPKDLLQGLFH
jgi:AsmA protein